LWQIQKMKKLLFLSATILTIGFSSCIYIKKSDSTQHGNDNVSAVIMSYNVENLFDTINDPENDDDFLPSGKLQWNAQRYQEKLNHIAQVINGVKTENGEKYPLVVGLIEVEHASCLEDLVALPSLAQAHYKVAFIEGEDERGIDVGMLYNADELKVSSITKHNIVLPDNDKTRHVLEVVGTWKGQQVAFYVNHWPSRSGGTEKSAPLRLIASATLEKVIQTRLQMNPNCKIIAMGDFNDYPTDISLTNLDLIDGGATTVNMMRPLVNARTGSHYYKGEWGFLDQFVVSSSLVDSIGSGLRVRGLETIAFNFMMYTNSKGEMSPARTYVGDAYKGGYSDHLPIEMELRFVK
jgi:predicted extracellular nuclease